MNIRFRENYDVRSLDFAFPRDAIDAVYAVERDFIQRGIFTRGVCSGPMMIGMGKGSAKMCNRVMLIDSTYADEFVAALEAAVTPFEVSEKDFGNFMKDVVES